MQILFPQTRLALGPAPFHPARFLPLPEVEGISAIPDQKEDGTQQLRGICPQRERHLRTEVPAKVQAKEPHRLGILLKTQFQKPQKMKTVQKEEWNSVNFC